MMVIIDNMRGKSQCALCIHGIAMFMVADQHQTKSVVTFTIQEYVRKHGCRYFERTGLKVGIPSPDDIKAARSWYGLSQWDVARRSGISQSMIARIESGKVDARLSTLRKVLAALHT
jgi:ribosome-binding protein aMBF1 (putative translation factor)